MICQDINKSELWVFEEISRKLQNSKNSHKNFCPNFWDRHRGSFFLFFYPDNESSEKKTFAEGGYGSTVSYPTISSRPEIGAVAWNLSQKASVPGQHVEKLE